MVHPPESELLGADDVSSYHRLDLIFFICLFSLFTLHMAVNKTSVQALENLSRESPQECVENRDDSNFYLFIFFIETQYIYTYIYIYM